VIRRGGGVVGSRPEYREQGEFSPPCAVDVENKEGRGEFSPPCAVGVEIERGGENPLLTPSMLRWRGEQSKTPSVTSRHEKGWV